MVVMPPLVTFSDGLAISATVLSLTAIGFGVAFFIVQTQQLYRGQKESADYVGEMKEVLGKIEGLTVGTRDQLQGQFDRVLRAALRSSEGTALADSSISDLAGASERADSGSGLTEDWRKERFLRMIAASNQTRDLVRRIVEVGGIDAGESVDFYKDGEGEEGLVRAAVRAMLHIGRLEGLDVLTYEPDSGRMSLTESAAGWMRELSDAEKAS